MKICENLEAEDCAVDTAELRSPPADIIAVLFVLLVHGLVDVHVGAEVTILALHDSCFVGLPSWLTTQKMERLRSFRFNRS